MEVWVAIAVGGMYAGAVYLMLRRSIAKLIIGLALLSHAANLLIFASSGMQRAQAPLIPEGALAPVGNIADPLPQALILTAIVIAFGVLAFALVLVQRTYQKVQTEDLDDMRSTDS